MAIFSHHATTTLLFITAVLLHLTATTFSIGVNYGTLGNNLPPPAEVANFLKTKTIINRIKLFDANPDILHAFANSGIKVTVTAANGDIPNLTQLPAAKQWVATNIAPFYPQTDIIRILVGNEVLHWMDPNQVPNLVPAMKTLKQALTEAGFSKIQVSTAHSLAILLPTKAPSEGRFRPDIEQSVLAPMLQFLKETSSAFVANPYPYFSYNRETLNYAIFKRNKGVMDPHTKITYYNMFDSQMDAIYSAMKALGHADIPIVVGETGWPSLAEPTQPEVNAESAATYNWRLIKHVSSRKGTPLMPNRKFETYIFALFNENAKPGPTAERNFGLFQPDFTPVYDAGVLKNGQTGKPNAPGGKPSVPIDQSGQVPIVKFCVPKAETSNDALQKNIDYVCSQGVDCKPIQAGGPCFEPNDVRAHAAYVMNAYYQTHGRRDSDCHFAETGVVTSDDPSTGTCKFVS